MDHPKFPVREQCPREGLVCLSKYYSKTCMDENSGRAPSDVHPISQQKRHPIRGVFLNGGPEGTRTPDLLRVKQALYQLSYRSEN